MSELKENIESGTMPNQNYKTAISVSNISKKFIIPGTKFDLMRDELFNFWRKKHYHDFYALKNISFEVRKGEFFSIIGRNGSGKSTLLKILANIYEPDDGTVKVHGGVSPFLELGIGFNPELSALDNIFLNGAILGLTRKEIKARFDDIINFSELHEFIDTKLKFFSTGMVVRLSFSLAVQSNKDILLMDEVLAVGDANFQKKCMNKFRQFISEGKTIVFVSHNLEAVREFSQYVMVIEKGECAFLGNPDEAINRYHIILSIETSI